MAKIQWDSIGERHFQTGVYNCVLYLEDRSGVAWNGVTSIKENMAGDSVENIFYDGERLAPYSGEEDFSATITAFTYPDEFLSYFGEKESYPGVFIDNQDPKQFHLSYKTISGNDIELTAYGYKIHILYNLYAKPNSTSRTTVSNTVEAVDFSWELNSRPEIIPGSRPTSHVIIDSLKLKPEILEYVENTLYGTDTTDPSIPPLSTFIKNINEWGLIIFTDNMDGTWTATGPDEYFSMTDPTTFSITNVNGFYVNTDTYQASSSVPD